MGAANDCGYLKCTYSCIRLIGCRAHPLISVNYFAFTVIIFTSVAMLIPTLRPNFNFSLVQVILLLFISIISFSTVSYFRDLAAPAGANQVSPRNFL